MRRGFSASLLKRPNVERSDPPIQSGLMLPASADSHGYLSFRTPRNPYCAVNRTVAPPRFASVAPHSITSRRHIETERLPVRPIPQLGGASTRFRLRPKGPLRRQSLPRGLSTFTCT